MKLFYALLALHACSPLIAMKESHPATSAEIVETTDELMVTYANSALKKLNNDYKKMINPDKEDVEEDKLESFISFGSTLITIGQLEAMCTLNIISDPTVKAKVEKQTTALIKLFELHYRNNLSEEFSRGRVEGKQDIVDAITTCCQEIEISDKKEKKTDTSEDTKS